MVYYCASVLLVHLQLAWPCGAYPEQSVGETDNFPERAAQLCLRSNATSRWAGCQASQLLPEGGGARPRPFGYFWAMPKVTRCALAGTAEHAVRALQCGKDVVWFLDGEAQKEKLQEPEGCAWRHKHYVIDMTHTPAAALASSYLAANASAHLSGKNSSSQIAHRSAARPLLPATSSLYWAVSLGHPSG